MTTERRDLALILARGRSRRMGRPKGLCVAADDPRPLIVRVAAPYMERHGRVAVVTTPDLADSYAAVLDDPRVIWIPADGGGGTARSVLIGARAVAGLATHLWLHPVDLPRVLPETLASLCELSRREPGLVLVPTWNERPGHPVVLPLDQSRGAWPVDHPGAMRDLLRDPLFRPHRIPCDDPGVSDDLDLPGDLVRTEQNPERGDE